MMTSGVRTRAQGLRITMRDLDILDALRTAPYLSTYQIQRLFWREGKGGRWGRVKACQQRLAKLVRHGYVRRIDQPVRHGEGAKPYIYALDRKGVDLLVTELGIEPQEIEWRPRSQEENFPFLNHILATIDFRIALVEACTQTGIVLQEWLDEKELKRSQNVDRVSLISPQGNLVDAAVVPDAYFMLCRDGRCGIFFLEVDLMTVTVAPSKWERRGWMRKIRAYEAYFRSDAFYRRYAGRRARVLTITLSRVRLQHLQRATENVFAELRTSGGDTSAEESFWFGLLDNSLAGSELLTAPGWYVAGYPEPRGLIG